MKAEELLFDHSRTLDTWTAQVGRERALEGSASWNGSSKEEAEAEAEAESAKVKRKPAPSRATLLLGLLSKPRKASFGVMDLEWDMRERGVVGNGNFGDKQATTAIVPSLHNTKQGLMQLLIITTTCLSG